MDDGPIMQRIRDLVEEERRLYSDDRLTDDERERRDRLRVELDQCWDLLRQRRALREFGGNPDAARPRPPEVVEGYEQ
jgi:hypothetical protein